MPLIRVLSKFLRAKCLTFCGGLEPAEQETVGGDGEKLVLRLLAVLVHWLTDSVKTDHGILQVCIVPIVSVGEDKKLKKFNEFAARLITG